MGGGGWRGSRRTLHPPLTSAQVEELRWRVKREAKPLDHWYWPTATVSTNIACRRWWKGRVEVQVGMEVKVQEEVQVHLVEVEHGVVVLAGATGAGVPDSGGVIWCGVVWCGLL